MCRAALAKPSDINSSSRPSLLTPTPGPRESYKPDVDASKPRELKFPGQPAQTSYAWYSFLPLASASNCTKNTSTLPSLFTPIDNGPASDRLIAEESTVFQPFQLHPSHSWKR